MMYHYYCKRCGFSFSAPTKEGIKKTRMIHEGKDPSREGTAKERLGQHNCPLVTCSDGSLCRPSLQEFVEKKIKEEGLINE